MGFFKIETRGAFNTLFWTLIAIMLFYILFIGLAQKIRSTLMPNSGFWAYRQDPFDVKGGGL